MLCIICHGPIPNFGPEAYYCDECDSGPFCILCIQDHQQEPADCPVPRVHRSDPRRRTHVL